MRKKIACVLISLLLLFPSSVFAASDRINVKKLTFDKVEQYINTYNTQIYSNNKAVADIKVPTDSDRAELQKTIDDIDAQIQYYDGEIAKLDRDNPFEKPVIDIYEFLKGLSIMNKESLKKQLQSFDENRNKALEAQTQAIMQVEAGNKQIIWGAEQIFIAYNSLNHQIKQQNNQLNLLYKQLDIMKLQKKLGMITGQTIKNVEISAKELDLAIKAMKDQQKFMKEQLNVMLNQNHDIDLEIGATPDPDLDLINAMNLEEDYKKAVALSFDVRAKSDSYEREAEKRKFKLAFKESFENVADKLDSLELEKLKLENQKSLYDQAALKHKLGMISKVAFEEQRIAYENQRLKAQAAEDELFKAYRQYEWMKKGLSL
jgi:hypothetical protein